MPRKKSQSHSVPNVRKASTENTSQNTDVELKWRDTSLKDLQSMFSGSVDPEVVLLVLSESNYNVNDALGKLFVLSGIDQDTEEHRGPHDSEHSTLPITSPPDDSTLSREKSLTSYSESKASSIKPGHLISPHMGTSVTLQQSSLHNSSASGGPFVKVSGYQSASPVLLNTDGAQNKVKGPIMMPPSFASPCNTSFYGGSHVEADSELHTNSSSLTLMTSGLPDFPDNVSQQFKALKSQTKMSGSDEKFFPHKQEWYNPSGRAAFRENVSDSFYFDKPSKMNQTGYGHGLKGNLESFLKQTISQNTNSEDWKKVPGDDRQQQKSDGELTEKKIHSINKGATVVQTSNNKEQGPYKQSTSHSNSSFTGSQTYLSSNPSQNIKETLPVQDLHKPQLGPTVNNSCQLPSHVIRNSSHRESNIRPPNIQRKSPPFLPSQRHRQLAPGRAFQPRADFMPGISSPWQQGPRIQVPRGQIPYQYPQGTFPYQHPFFFGRAAHPVTAVRATRPASGVSIPFIPTIHQKLLILIRGLPGSGKSTLALKLKGSQGVVLSTDDFFYRNQRYDFDIMLLGEAHEWNQKRAKSALEKWISPVIIDNTNTQCWEMKPYVSMGLKHGYYIKFIEPDTTWKWNVKELARRNRHGVGIEAITRMKERYEQNVTIEKIMRCDRMVDLNKTGSDFDTCKETGADNRMPSPTPQRSSHGRGSEDLGKRENGSALNVAGSEMKSSSQDFKSEKTLEAKEGGVLGGSKNENNGSEKLETNVNFDGMREQCSSEIITSPERLCLKKEQNHENCSPKPQRVPRVRDKRSPFKQRDNAESPSVVCEDNVIVKQQGDISSNNLNELELNNDTSTSPRSETEVGSEVLSIEDLELSNVEALADIPASSPFFSESRTDQGIVEEAQAVELSSSTICDADSPPLSDEGSPPVPIVSVKDTDKSGNNTQSSVREAKTNDFSIEKAIEGRVSYDLESPNEKTSLSLRHIVDKDNTKDRNVPKYHEPSGGKSLPIPPPLSSLLASASRIKQKKRPSSNNDRKQPITEERKCIMGNDKIPSETVKEDEKLDPNDLNRGVDDGSITPEIETSAKDVSNDVQNLTDGLKHVASGDSDNDMPAGVEFLKTCFPDVDSDLMNSLLTENDNNVMKVVDELLASDGGLPTFPEDAFEVTEQQGFVTAVPISPDTKPLATEHGPFNFSTEKPESFKPDYEMLGFVDATSGSSQQSWTVRENAESPGYMSTKLDKANQLGDLGPTPATPAQAPGHGTFQLTLEPAVALHLIEMFGHFVGINFQEEISGEDLVIDVDNSFAKQLYKKWERCVQTRKGISVSKQGSSPQANRGLTNSASRNYSGVQSPSGSQRSSPRVTTGLQAGTLREIMDEQLALELSRNSNVAESTEQDIATKIKRQKLYDMFPGVDPVALEEVFQANRYELIPSVEAVKASCNLSDRQIPNTVVSPGFKSAVRNQEHVTTKEAEGDWSWLYLEDSSRPSVNEDSFQTLDAPSYLDFRAEAFQHYKQRDECFKKAALAFSKKQGPLAQFYAQQGHLHTQKIKEANARAAALILDQRNELTDENTIDLHGLHVTEAIVALETMLSEKTDPQSTPSRKSCKAISVITGRGNNSRGGKARIKPAVLEYLKKNNYRYTEPHPGLVKVHL